MTDYISREIVGVLNESLENMPVVVISGLRQVGKTTLLTEDPCLRDRYYINLDDYAQLEVSRTNPESLLSPDKLITIEEVQRQPDLIISIKQLVDQKRESGKFLLSGSANLLLVKNISESLAGRAVYLSLQPFTRRELHRTKESVPFLVRFLRTQELPDISSKLLPVEANEVLLGGLPPVCLKLAKNPSIWFKGFEQTYLERDLRDLSQVADLISFRHLFRLAALRSGQVMNISELARDAKLSSATANRYINLLETSFVIYRLQPFLGNKASRLIKSPKLYISDSGLASYLGNVNRLTPDNQMYGALFETYIHHNLKAILENHATGSTLSYWNVQGRYEVDFVVEYNGNIVAIEIKSGTRWNKRDFSSLRAFQEKTPGCSIAFLAYNGTKSIQIDKKLWAIPISQLLS
ncbi:MAG: hypothetical protein A2161_11935 [Candidatus Schekmanbacteria bacterium RBG_13_48_7]|uniref:ATPase n=1 Tax=Candidatus Schekmanbacteria bacterium RBG_13_48_7 TaxID=1817878 RepID=A0A1F7S152_9BACT|nr:MAG: hypothetical protein A2161_11935 [Candidatus Schekmanbacteria bacterium RBG_13_48_7]